MHTKKNRNNRLAGGQQSDVVSICKRPYKLPTYMYVTITPTALTIHLYTQEIKWMENINLDN